jgi:hypothetical protein
MNNIISAICNRTILFYIILLSSNAIFAKSGIIKDLNLMNGCEGNDARNLLWHFWDGMGWDGLGLN